MTVSSVLEVGVGLILVYYVLSLIVSYITSEITKWTEMRAKGLESELRALLADSGKFEAFMQHPLIEALRPKRLRLFRNEVVAKQVAQIPANTAALTVLDLLAPGEDGKGTLADIRAAIAALPDSRLKSQLQSLINAGVKDLEDARRRVETWADDVLTNVGLLYQQHARRVVVAVALVVTVVTGTDTLAIATNLWQEPSLRMAVAAKADEFIAQEPAADVQAYIASLEALELPLFWNANALPADASGWAVKVAGLLITWAAAAQGSSFWYDTLKRIRGEGSGGTAGQSAGSAAG